MLLSAFLWCIDNITKNSSSFYISPTLAIIFKFRNRQHMKNNIRYKGNINNTSVIIFFKSKSKTPSDVTLLGRTSEDVFVMLGVVLHLFLIFISFLYLHLCIFILLLYLHLSFFFMHIFFSTSFLTLPWTLAGFLHPFYTFSPAHRKVTRDTFIFYHSVIFLPKALRSWVGIFYPQAFFILRSFTNILTCVYQGFPFFYHHNNVLRLTSYKYIKNKSK